MKLEQVLKIAIICGFQTIGEIIEEIKEWPEQIFSYGNFDKEKELYAEYEKLLAENESFTPETTITEILEFKELNPSELDIGLSYKEIEERVELPLRNVQHFSKMTLEDTHKYVRHLLDSHCLVKSYYYRIDDCISFRIEGEQFYFLNVAWIDISNHKNNIHLTSIYLSKSIGREDIKLTYMEGFMEEEENK